MKKCFLFFCNMRNKFKKPLDNIIDLKFSLKRCVGCMKGNIGILSMFFSQLPPMISYTRLENNKPAIILSQFRHLI